MDKSAILGKFALTTVQIALGFALCDFCAMRGSNSPHGEGEKARQDREKSKDTDEIAEFNQDFTGDTTDVTGDTKDVTGDTKDVTGDLKMSLK